MSENTQLMLKEVSYVVAGEEVRLTGGMVKSYLTRGNGKVTDQELVMFMNLCKYQQLNPFLNEAYLVKFGDSSPATIVVGKEAFMKRAESSEAYEGQKAGIIVERKGEVVYLDGCFSLKDDILLGGWCEVHRNDRKYPIRAEVNLEEYSKSQSTWKTMPKTMIRKVAIVQALREAFPSNLGACYTEDEYKEPTPQEEQKQNTASKEFVVETPNQEVLDVEYNEESTQKAPVNCPI